MAELEIVNASFHKVFDACMKLGCEKLSVIKQTKEGRLHINITPSDNYKKTKVKVHHDIFIDATHHGHYSKSNDPATKKFISDLKKELALKE